MQESDGLLDQFTSALKTSPFEAYFWEAKPTSNSSINQEFEFVLVNSLRLRSITADQRAFSEHFKVEDEVVCFPNLGGDARLIVPRSISDSSIYSHLARFMRNGTSQQITSLWRQAVREYDRQISDKPVWFSTAGLGVSWLHLRIDSRPKYYRYKQYKML